MRTKKEIQSPVKHVSGGVVLAHHKKRTAENETVVMPSPAVVKIPLSQHIGISAKPVVKNGERVYVGTLIGEATGTVSACVHSSVSGTVTDINTFDINGKSVECVVIKSDGKMESDPNLKPFAVNSIDDVAKAAYKCGLVGLGGAGFPTSVKLTMNDEKPIDTLIINAAECEPYITSDYRECIENYNDIVDGIFFLKEKLHILKVVICVESNKKRAIGKLFTIASNRSDFNDYTKIMKLPTKYPQGAEKVLIYSATGRKLPVGKLPSDVGCLVMNITTVATLYRFIKSGMPLVSKRLTVDGTAVSCPKNVIAPIGTAIKDLLDFVGGISEDVAEIIAGGPMMGFNLCGDDAVVEKRNNAITVMKESTKLQPTTPCIHCGRCAAACPMRLYPSSVESAIKYGMTEKLADLNINCCMECGCCSYICPAKRPLTQVMRLAKAELRREKK